jgi:(1->4)-alpha-D-glucan 1-alpha-D-glucosylmutase
MLATSTHDSKRSEDVRARINVLSEMPGLWRLRVRQWRQLSRSHRSVVNEKPAPSPNDEYLLYQTLVGAWPVEPFDDANDWKVFRERIQNYILKAMREAKQYTSWINQNMEYETAVSSFVAALLNPDSNNRFLNDFVPFQQHVARLGLWNSLSQTLLKLTCPGVPDIYQGNDLLDFSLVDPDSRRPVDYRLREQAFKNIRNLCTDPEASAARELLKTPADGRLKLFETWKALCLRKEHEELFRSGEYLPLTAHGSKANHVIAFLRRLDGMSALVVVPRLVASLLNESSSPPIGLEVWADTYILLPSCNCSNSYRNVFTGQIVDPHQTGDQLRVDAPTAFADFPVGLFLN